MLSFIHLLFLVSLLTPPAVADPSSSKSSVTRVQVSVVVGTNSHNRVDSQVRELAKQFRKGAQASYSGYELIETKTVRLSIGQSQAFFIPGGRRLVVKGSGYGNYAFFL